MRVEEFDYELPEERIAQAPAAQRDASRMLLVERRGGRLEDRWFRDLPSLLQTGDLLVVNNSRVFPARLYGYRQGVHAQPPPSLRNPAHRDYLHGLIEVLLTRQLADDCWEGLVRPGRKLANGERLSFGEELSAEIIGRGAFGERQLRFTWNGGQEAFQTLLDRLGHMPLPPYIHRERGAPDRLEDRERYQTVFARSTGSVAAPTAGLHFTPEIFEQLRARGVRTAEVTLHVGLGTFQPMHVDVVEEHVMHAESFSISEETAAAIQSTRAAGGRVVAVGTTVVRTLETSARQHGGQVRAASGETQLFLYPGQQIASVDALLTNFHAPRSTLLLLVAAFAGTEVMRQAYRHALEKEYRFLSYGDCMLIA